MADPDSKTYLRFVESKFTKTTFDYLFYSRLDKNKHAAYGQKPLATNNPVTSLIMGANNFKPNRATILLDGDKGFESSFCSDDKVQGLFKTNHQISTKKAKIYSGGKLGKVYFVKYNNVCFGWIRPKVPQGVNLKEINVQELTNQSEIIFGASFPRPTVVGKRLGNGSLFQTFCGLDALSGPAKLKESVEKLGWEVLKEGLYTADQLTAKFQKHIGLT